MRARLPDGFVEATAAELERRSLDGWLLFDLEGRNRVTCELLGLGDGPSRRIFLLLRPGAKPSALAHRIELDAWDATSLVNCADATADTCVCAGAS